MYFTHSVIQDIKDNDHAYIIKSDKELSKNVVLIDLSVDKFINQGIS